MPKTRITIIGCGFMGTVFGYAIKAHMPEAEVIGHDKDQSYGKRAESAKAIDKHQWNLPSACEKAALVLLCIPSDGVEITLKTIGRDLSAGAIIVDGLDMAALDDNAATQLRRARMGFVFQAFHVLPHLTLQQNVALPLLLNGANLGRADAMLEAVGLGGRGADFPRQLSGGEMQRVAIARALVHRPALVLADEPTGNLDPDTAQHILLVLRDELRSNGASAVMVTHSHAAAATADRVLILSQTGLRPA